MNTNFDLSLISEARMSKLQNKLIARFEDIEEKVMRLCVLVQSCREAVTLIMDYSNVILEELIRSTDQERSYHCLSQNLDHIHNVFTLIIRQGSIDFHFTFNVNLFEKVPTSSEVTQFESVLLSGANLKLGGISLRGHALKLFCQGLYQDLHGVSQLVSTEELYEIFH